MNISSVSGKNWIYKKFDSSDVKNISEKLLHKFEKMGNEAHFSIAYEIFFKKFSKKKFKITLTFTFYFLFNILNIAI